MTLLDARGALLTLLNLMVLPGALLVAAGGYFWYTGWQKQVEDRIRLGRMLLMFGIILLIIDMISSYFLNKIPT